MSSCNLLGPISSSLVKLQSLSVIRLNQNNLSSLVPESFVNLLRLITLELSNCGLNGIFPKSIFNMQTLQVLDISDNHYLHGSLPDFSYPASLHALNLSNTNFSGPLSDSIGKLRQLSRLDLSSCQFNGALPDSISKLLHLVFLDLSSNNFIGLLPSFNMCKNLTYLSLSHNNLTGEIQSSHFNGLTNIVSIDLRHNNLNGSVPSTLFMLPSLRQLDLSNNQFLGQLDRIPRLSPYLLETLSLSGNKLYGEIPLSFFLLKRLSVLQLSSNNFNGTIEFGMLGKLRNLFTLDLSHNNFSVGVDFKNDNLKSLIFPNLSNLMMASCNLKVFPYFLRNQTKLLALDLSNNQIPGTIPNWIWRLELLASLNLSNNFLTDLEGPLEDVTPRIFVLDLHSNQLQGSVPFLSKYASFLDYSNIRFNSIPHDLGNHLPYLVVLYLANNSFHGEIHDSLCNASNIRLLDLSYNNFSGMIPQCLIAMSKTLRVLKLGENQLSGNIPDIMPSSCSMRFLDLNGNLLKGKIPKFLSNCNKLQVLNLGNNLLNDKFPCFLKNVSTLRVLILRSNKLHGVIGCPNSVGNWEMLQIIDIASNGFGGNLPKLIFKTSKAMMLDEDSIQFGHLSSDVIDKFGPKDILDIFSAESKVLENMYAKMLAIEPATVIEYFFSNVYMDIDRYQDSITIVNKGQQMKLVKILTAFASLDFSSNHFEGTILEELMNFKALHALNLSHNALLGSIPTSLSNLNQLESLDLSMNSLSGKIPRELANLDFLSFLNLSFNHLVGEILTGTQIQTFDVASFIGNEGLCGPPLPQSCNSPPPASGSPNSDNSKSSIDWNFFSTELGLTFGLGIFILPLVFSQQWRLSYLKLIDSILCRIFPQLDIVYELRGGRRYQSLRWMRY